MLVGNNLPIFGTTRSQSQAPISWAKNLQPSAPMELVRKSHVSWERVKNLLITGRVCPEWFKQLK